MRRYTSNAVLQAYAGFLEWFKDHAPWDAAFDDWEEQFSALRSGSLKWPVPFKHDNRTPIGIIRAAVTKMLDEMGYLTNDNMEGPDQPHSYVRYTTSGQKNTQDNALNP